MTAAGDPNVMDWSNPMAMFGLTADPVEGEHEFYKPAAATAEQKQSPSHASTLAEQPFQQSLAADIKIANQRKADLLRAKLLAQRQNTPSKTLSRASTPHQPQGQTGETPSKLPAIADTIALPGEKTEVTEASHNIDNVEALLATGKAMAEAQSAAMARGTSDTFVSQPNLPAKTAIQPNGPSQARECSIQRHQAVQPLIDVELQPPEDSSNLPHHPNSLSDAYYADLPAWLEITGYHDTEFRESKLHTYKERKALEQEAVRIADRLEQLRQAEEQITQSLRSNPPRQASSVVPPSLPATMPTARPQMNGVKRTHSPDSFPAKKLRNRDDMSDQPARSANGTPENLRAATNRLRPASPRRLIRRINHNESRGRSPVGEHHPPSRDPSLERRQSYYRRAASSPTGYDHYTPQDSRVPYNMLSRSNSYSRPQYRGGTGFGGHKGSPPSLPD